MITVNWFGNKNGAYAHGSVKCADLSGAAFAAKEACEKAGAVLYAATYEKWWHPPIALALPNAQDEGADQ